MKSNLLTIAIVLIFAGACGCSRQGNKSAASSANDKTLVAEGAACFAKGDLDCAIEKYNSALGISETSETWNLLGMAFRFKYNATMLGEWKEKEIGAFGKAIELNGKNVMAIKNLGATYYFMGEKVKAAGYLERALELNPYDPEKERIEEMIAEGKE